MVSDTVLYAIALVLGTFLGPGLFAVWVRRQERFEREPWSSVGLAFAWGATGAVLLTLLVSGVLAVGDSLQPIGVSSALVSAVVVAPLVEEAAKGLGLRWVPDPWAEVEDGLVYGAAAGLGFSATENVVYGVSAFLDGGLQPLVVTIAVRTVTSSLLHAAASGLVGYAIWRMRAREGSALGLAVFYLGAVAFHAAFNVLAAGRLWSTFLAGAFVALAGFSWVRRRVRELDQPV